MPVPTLTELVHRDLRGAELRGQLLMGEYGPERDYVVVWRKGEEWGTHRALIGQDKAILLWGHYFRGSQAIVDAYKSFCSRIAEGT